MKKKYSASRRKKKIKTWNQPRIEWAEIAIVVFQAVTGTDREDAAADLLCDLMHWCDANGFDFETELDQARDHYDYESKHDD